MFLFLFMAVPPPGLATLEADCKRTPQSNARLTMSALAEPLIPFAARFSSDTFSRRRGFRVVMRTRVPSLAPHLTLSPPGGPGFQGGVPPIGRLTFLVPCSSRFMRNVLLPP